MTKITNLQERIENIAKHKLNADIQEASDNFSKFLASQKGLFRTGISISINTDTGKIYPYLSQLIECSEVRDQIIKYNLPEYIEREINTILNK